MRVFQHSTTGEVMVLVDRSIQDLLYIDDPYEWSEVKVSPNERTFLKESGITILEPSEEHAPVETVLTKNNQQVEKQTIDVKTSVKVANTFIPRPYVISYGSCKLQSESSASLDYEDIMRTIKILPSEEMKMTDIISSGKYKSSEIASNSSSDAVQYKYCRLCGESVICDGSVVHTDQSTMKVDVYQVHFCSCPKSQEILNHFCQYDDALTKVKRESSDVWVLCKIVC